MNKFLEKFSEQLTIQMRLKVDENVFNRRLADKAAANDFGALYLDVNKMKVDIFKIQESLEKKADEKFQGPTPTEVEVLRLQESKADRVELDHLRAEVHRLEKLLNQLEEEYSEDSYDEYDDEDSQVEDVISLAEGLSAGKEEEQEDDEEEEFFDGDEDPAKKLADKAKELASKSLLQGIGFEPTRKVGEMQEKPDKIKEEMDKEKEEEVKKTAHRKNTDLNQDMQETLKKIDAEEKKSIPSTNGVDCAETNHSMAMTMNTFNNGNSRAAKLRGQETMRSRKKGLSRMSSKMSISTRKRRGGVRGADSKEVNELKLNMKKVLDDIRKLNNFEYETEGTLRRFENTLVDLKKKNDMFVSQHSIITKKQEEIDTEHKNAMEEAERQTKKVVQIYKDIQKLINNFKSEYRYGFKKIIKAEVDISVLNQQLKFIKTKYKPKEEEKLNKNDLLKEIDGRFEILYDQVAEMASDQAQFNRRIQRDQESLKEPLQIEISKIREESNIMLRELERTQHTNREIMMQKMNHSMYEDTTPTKLNAWLSNLNTSCDMEQRRTNFSITSRKAAPNKIRYSTPAYPSSDSKRLKRFNLQKEELAIPNFTNLIKNPAKSKNLCMTPSITQPTANSVSSQIKSLLSKKGKESVVAATPKYRAYSSTRK